MNNGTEDQGHRNCPAWCRGHEAPGHWAMPYEVQYGRLEAADMVRDELSGVEVTLNQYPGQQPVVVLSGADNDRLRASGLGVYVNLLLTAEEAQQLGRALIDAGRTVSGAV